METASASAFVSDAELTEYVNNGAQDLYDKLVAARGHEFYAATDTFSTVAGTTDYALPADWYSTIVLVATDGGGTYQRLRAWNYDDYHELLNTQVQGTAYTCRARVSDTNVVLLPAPTEVFTVRHVYIPTFTRLASDSDTFDGINGWEEYVVLWAARAMLTKEESLEQAAAIGGDLMGLAKRIEDLAEHRHSTEPDMVQDLRRDAVAWWYWDDDHAPRDGW